MTLGPIGVSRFGHSDFLLGLREPPALPVEAPCKKALASSIEQSEKRTTTLLLLRNYHLINNARLRAVGQVMQVVDFSVPLERLAGMIPFQGLHKPPA